MDAVLGVLARGGTVVTANNRLARSIELEFNRRQASAGRGAWPTPCIVPWRVWLERLWWTSFDAAGEAGRHTLLSDAQARTLWREIVRETSATGLPGADRAAADLAGKAWRLCQDWLVGPGMLAEEADSGDSQTFAAWAAQYRDRCAREGWVDARMAVPHLIADLRGGRAGLTGSVCLAGFDELPPLHQDLVRAMAGIGIEVLVSPAPSAVHGGGVRVECAEQRHELETAARWARWHREQQPGATISVVVPDLATRAPEVRREFLDVFAPDWRLQPGQEHPVNFSYGDALARTGVGRAALLILRTLTGQLDYSALGELLKTPYVPGWPAELSARARLELSVREQLGTRVDLRWLIRRENPQAAQFNTRLRALLDYAGTLPHRQGAARWADSFAAALQAMGWPGDRPLNSDEHQAAEALQGLLATLSSCEAMAGPMGLQRALGLLDDLAREQVFQPAGNPQVVQVLGVMEALGQRFDHLWICGLTSAAWPAPARPDALVPLGLQRRLRLPDSSPAACRERAERQLRWLMGGAGSVVVSWPRLRGDEGQTPSPLISLLSAADPARLARWEGPRLHDTLLGHGQIEDLIVDPAPAVASLTTFRGGSSLMEKQARCPARAFLEFRLGAREVATPAVGIEASKRGTLTHAVLETFFRRITDHDQLCALSMAAQERLLRDSINAQMHQQLPMGDPLIRALARLEGDRLYAMLSQFLASEREREGFRVIWTEEMPMPATLPAAVTALGINLRPDRVDELPGGGTLVIDYKTGRNLPSPKEIFGPRPRSPQLPLYATAIGARGVAFLQLTIAGSRWSGVGEGCGQIPGIVPPERWTRNEVADWSELRASWWTALERLAAGFLGGDFTVDRWRHDEALGQWAMAIRINDLPDPDDSEADA